MERIGDIVGRGAFTHMSIDEAHAAPVDDILAGGGTRAASRCTPSSRVTFTTEISSVRMTRPSNGDG